MHIPWLRNDRPVVMKILIVNVGRLDGFVLAFVDGVCHTLLNGKGDVEFDLWDRES
jgi:hypothetical protein